MRRGWRFPKSLVWCLGCTSQPTAPVGTRGDGSSRRTPWLRASLGPSAGDALEELDEMLLAPGGSDRRGGEFHGPKVPHGPMVGLGVSFWFHPLDGPNW